ncbi:hypothetical protein [Maridesulfovibrio salexigens]|uniref:Uncharacterized protein n=1 Tax=Maridesulfovibrio salexigens (strain ATCC 14822 / DSM 2638 / NCIMB 8403 / VKM B-1763) TaxID=526222 RepID=C6C042_MARSD|nr:hypothetical protein [Maridesulfovibrio salexigens]ACS80913.1 hypothetical protein Desal_2861 [Maridesulfovibrio salexigens DSM 2638]
MTKDCSTSYEQKKITLRDPDNKSTAIVKLESNSDIKFDVIDFDGCLMKEKTACDFVVTTEHNEALYVELKGSDLKHAYAQIEAAAVHFKKDHSNHKKTGIISFSGKFGTPKTKTTLNALDRNLKKKFSLTIVREKSPLTYKFKTK